MAKKSHEKMSQWFPGNANEHHSEMGGDLKTATRQSGCLKQNTDGEQYQNAGEVRPWKN